MTTNTKQEIKTIHKLMAQINVVHDSPAFTKKEAFKQIHGLFTTIVKIAERIKDTFFGSVMYEHGGKLCDMPIEEFKKVDRCGYVVEGEEYKVLKMHIKKIFKIAIKYQERCDAIDKQFAADSD